MKKREILMNKEVNYSNNVISIDVGQSDSCCNDQSILLYSPN